MERLILRPLFTFLAVLLVTACGQSGSGESPLQPESPPTVVVATPVAPLETVDPNLLKVGYAADAPPFVTKGVDSQPAGFDIELMKAIAEQEGLRLQFVEVKDFGTIF